MDKLNEEIKALQIMADSLENHLMKLNEDMTDLPTYRTLKTKYENLIWEVNANKRKLEDENKYMHRP